MKKTLLLLSLIAFLFTYLACSKSDPEPPANPCAGTTVTVTAVVTNASTGQSNGSIVATAAGTGITFSINGGVYQASGTFINLAAGAYTISAKNASGCTGSAQFTVGATNPCIGVTVTVTGTVTHGSAANNDGSILAAATGGSGFTYSMNGGAFQATGLFSNLAAGVYTITAKNSAGCTGSAQFTVNNVCTGVTVTVTGTVTHASGANNDGSINASATGGTGFTYSINNGTTFQASGLFSNLTAGVYTIIAKNSNGCTGNAQFTVNNVCTGVTITVTGVVTNAAPAQSNGSINATATGGTGFTYSINGGTTYQASGLFSNLAAGVYTIIAKNSNNCTGSAQFTVGTTNPCAGVTITVTTTTTSATQCAAPNGSITVTASGGQPPYNYNLNAGVSQASNMFTGLTPGSYTVVVTDMNGCTQSASAVVSSAAPGPLFNAVKQVLSSNCALSGCHLSPNPQNGIDFTINCTIVAQSDRIRERAVNGNPSFMPPIPNPQLSAADKQKIVDWVNAGGQVSN